MQPITTGATLVVAGSSFVLEVSLVVVLVHMAFGPAHVEKNENLTRTKITTPVRVSFQ